MGIYLPNMEMPKNCGDCKAFVCYRQWAGDVGDCFCGITKNDAEAKKKNADCPLVLVPPHGRLIDADEIKKRISHMNMEAYMDGACYGIHPSLEYLDLLNEILDDAPTIIPAEEKQL